jgi:hypothetical protein
VNTDGGRLPPVGSGGKEKGKSSFSALRPHIPGRSQEEKSTSSTDSEDWGKERDSEEPISTDLNFKYVLGTWRDRLPSYPWDLPRDNVRGEDEALTFFYCTKHEMEWIYCYLVSQEENRDITWGFEKIQDNSNASDWMRDLQDLYMDQQSLDLVLDYSCIRVPKGAV